MKLAVMLLCMKGTVSSIDALAELKLKVAEQGGQGEFRDDLDEGFTNANAAASQEGRERVRVASLALRCQVVGTFCIESLWNESLGLDPLARVIAQVCHIDRD
eukprot:CAMPEP_0185603594 /NCGR_PEP_ID=MMETSP0436-20130131/2609_1 /TAXON_ID=626734 ORGANISM="Favella taraikaensis, Strain Fe Narragansett Bay" /NCGR_SAMPLE_ID=MMETSP0436 /ASSEMBLY_ACC=CAM_ASM_000390 /LENGTH=102 /DNA_ID=CAMNT_0028234141 /DNA_START=71 /DNA_END=378 /DNA_ORIENTATION=-